MTVLKALKVTHVTVHVAAFAQRLGDAALAAVDARPDLQLVAESDGIRLYHVRQGWPGAVNK